MKSEKKSKPRNRRERSKYPALDPALNLKIRNEEIDYDYVDKLSEKDKSWLNSFTEEYINANLKHKGKKLHKSKKDRKICYDKNNHRNSDILSRGKVRDGINYFEDMRNGNDLSSNENEEDNVISKIDNTKLE